jgi:hypothetical protein
MPLPIIQVSLYPNVPLLLGVPQLVRSILFPPTPLPVLNPVTQDVLVAANTAAPQWGIFTANLQRQVVTPDNVYAFDNRNEWRVSDYPVQTGSFASYNKVVIPYDVTVRLTKGGSLSDRKVFLDQIAAIAGDTNLYTVLTPERSYSNVNVTRYETIRRSGEGAYFLEVDVFLRNIIQVTAQYSNTATNTSNAQNASALPPVNQGNVQPSNAPPAAATSQAAGAISKTVQ